MLVDDEPLNNLVLEKRLRSIGYEHIVCTTDPTQVLDMIRREPPDLLLLDIMMPQLNGLDLLRQIRDEEELRFLPVIILTAFCDEDNRHEGLEAGANDFLPKPVDARELAARVRNVLAFKERQDQLFRTAQQLKAEIGQRTEELAAARHAAEVRYLAGKAEIATDVLHNVGNALHSVNVAVNLLAYTLRESKLPSLKRATDLLLENAGNPARFLTKDERGRILPSYLADLAENLLEEREGSLREIELLTKHLAHINAVVATQQRYARLCNVCEPVALADLLRDAEELLSSGLARHAVEVTRDYRNVPVVSTDQQKLLQVAVNVIKNAFQSVRQQHPDGGGRIALALRPDGPAQVSIEVRDNGVGIAREHLTKIFGHGFTTKKDGNGFGLHSCANIMKELGGAIDAQSGGPGQGAVFSITVPVGSTGQQQQAGQ
jgi:DNA-binding response OmpR family regulator